MKNKKYYTIPKIQWEQSKAKGFDGRFRPKWVSTNTIVDYTIQTENSLYRCYYGGRYREFNNLNAAKEWAEEVHYPAQVEKYLDKYEIPHCQ